MPTNQQDVRVRLSAEGMAEVVGAFRKIADEGKKSAHETNEAFKLLNEQFREMGKSLLGGLSLIYAIDKLKEFTKVTLENAETLTRLSKQTGLSTAAIQAFQRAARESGLSAVDANQGLTKFSVALGKAELGSTKTATALGFLGVTTKQIAALNPDQRLELIAQKLAGVGDQAKRNAVEVQLFSRAGSELDQTLVALGREGLGKFIENLKELGVFLDQETLRELVTAKERLRDVEDQTKGLATQFLAGLVPALGQTADQMAKAGTGADNMRQAGEVLGTVLKSVILVLEVLGRIVEIPFNILINSARRSAAALDDLVHGRFIASLKDMGQGVIGVGTEIKSAFDDIVKGSVDLFANLGDPIKVNKPPPSTATGPTPEEIAAARARYDLLVARLDNELRAIKESNLQRDAEDKGAYQRGELSLQEYYDRRAVRIAREYDRQIAIVRQKLAAEEALPNAGNDEVARLQNLAKQEKLRGEIAQLNAQKQLSLQQDRNTLQQQLQTNAAAQIKAEETLLNLAGKKVEAARLELGLKAQTLAKELLAGGVSPEDAATAVGKFTAQGTAKIDFDETADKGKATLADLQARTRAIDDQINQGLTFSIAGEQQKLAIEKQMLPLLQQEADAMLAQAQAAGPGNEALLAQAEAFREKVQQIGVATNEAGQQMKELRDGVEGAVGAGFNTFLTDAIQNSKTLGQAFDAAAKQIISDLEKMAIKIEEEKFLKALFSGDFFKGFGSLFGAGGGAGAGLTSDVGLGSSGSLNAASGGYVSGPGSATSDSIPAMLSNREYVVSARATAQPGMLALLEAINAGLNVPQLRIARFAAGGLVSSLKPGAFGGGSAHAPVPPVELHIAPEALNMTLRDWFERELADISAKR